MAFWSELLKQVSDGGISFTISIEGGDVAEISFKGKKIIVEIKSALLALEFGIKEAIKNEFNEEKKGKKKAKNIDMSAFENIKKAGYKIIVKYKMIEIEI